MSKDMTPAAVCFECDGDGERDDYGHRGVCRECMGTGKALNEEQRQILEMVDRLIAARLRWRTR